LSTKVPFRSFRMRLVAFPVSKWLLPAWARRIFPVAVVRNLFDAPRLLFIFGMIVFSLQLHGTLSLRRDPE
jgi:hypothetical protein